MNRFNQNIIQFENTEELYGVVYYFHRNRTDLDADNISKPVWDCLQSILFSNDLQVKLRMAGVVDISYGKYWELSETLYETGLNEEFEHFFENRNHIVYIECGRLKPDMFQFNLEEQNAN
ncbi:MAG: RusA family crossover junction endodeoxyribonuclease [Calditrichaeota bacterium]|nr:RusA family crossover junction endodeoxyribonuclease [Calditrichota bacterium]